MYWLRLIRWNNLLIILFTQLLAWWCVIVPMATGGLLYSPYTATSHFDGQLLLNPLNFSLLCISTTLIAAAGYVINDYFDIKIDSINKPDKVILEKQIPRRLAIIVHSVMNAVAILLAGIVAWQAQHPELVLFQALCTYLLWRYSTTWKRRFMIGNVIVAFMTSFTVVALILFEPGVRQLIAKPPVLSAALFEYKLNPAWMLYFLAFFAFVLTWMREIVKDMEDYKGDAEDGCITMPIQWGLKKSIRFTLLLGGITVLTIIFCALYCVGFDTMAFIPHFMPVYLTVLLASIIAWMLYLPKKFTKAHFHKASTYLKLIMVLGIGSLIIYRLQYA